MKMARVWIIWIAAPVAITLVHELGHLLLAVSFGARPLGFVVGPFGGGYAQYDHSQLSQAGSMFALAGGMLLNLATGIPLLVASKRLRVGSWSGVAASVLGGLSIVFVAGYLFLGVYRGIGDPARLIRLVEPSFFSFSPAKSHLRTSLTMVLAVGVLVATWICARAFMPQQNALWPRTTRLKRVILAAMLASPLAIMFALRALVYDPSGVGQQVFRSGPRATMAILAELEATEPDLDGQARLARAAEIMRERRARGPVDNRPEVVLGGFIMLAAMTLAGGVAAASYRPTQ